MNTPKNIYTLGENGEIIFTPEQTGDSDLTFDIQVKHELNGICKTKRYQGNIKVSETSLPCDTPDAQYNPAELNFRIVKT